MKKLLLLFLLLACLCPVKSFAEEIHGKLQYEDVFGLYFIEDPKEGTVYFYKNALKNATKEFKKCVDNMKYKGNLLIKAYIGLDPEGGACRVCQFADIDKNSICKRK